ncbi:MAG: hypothetical protein ACLQFR_11040 [Streptosporangiaceae bacterium]
MLTYWCARFSNNEVNELHAAAFAHEVTADDWWYLVNQHSLGWVCALNWSTLIGFVNVPGMAHHMHSSSTPSSLLPRSANGSGPVS